MSAAAVSAMANGVSRCYVSDQALPACLNQRGTWATYLDEGNASNGWLDSCAIPSGSRSEILIFSFERKSSSVSHGQEGMVQILLPAIG